MSILYNQFQHYYWLSSTRKSEDKWLEDQVKTNNVRDGWWAFSEMTDGPKPEGMVDWPVPCGLARIKEYGINNVILELDLFCRLVHCIVPVAVGRGVSLSFCVE